MKLKSNGSNIVNGGNNKMENESDGMNTRTKVECGAGKLKYSEGSGSLVVESITLFRIEA
jgi:hypothetical protein